MVGVGALLTKKKLKCQVCGEYNDTGNAEPYEGPASRKYRKQYEAETAVSPPAPPPPSSPASIAPPPPPSLVDDRLLRLERLASLHASGALSDEEFASVKAELIASTSSPDEPGETVASPEPHE